ncbi:BglG family transcription antiterminator [Candidatus Cetobacterium colombiensis]|uniref:Mga helix-turn-helix domain-containing protein n=1 Tax=Candidatus Cetobacterium colombiensis TaxID=3073100 RepID=A0ABU4W7U5_9FUSO|nr:hypothetical protein [Candidatus Cetobacterium colombiensis]MDX8335255.1 hypothetical protein [Candidatus Cetobacterium colombiensis]
MNTTVTNILKLLAQSKMSAEDIMYYVDVEKSAIQKSVNQLNELLETLNLNTIKKEKDHYILKLQKKDLEYLYSNMKFLTTDEKIDYLYLKFIYKGFLNLEKEKEILDISRSTVLRCFKDVKETLDKNGSNYDYIYSKGLKLNNIGEKEKAYFCKKLIKYFIENSYMSSPLRDLIEEIRGAKVEDRVIKVSTILERLNIITTYPFIAFLISLESCIKVFNGFEKYYEKEGEKDEEFKHIINIVQEVGKDFDLKYSEQITRCLKNYVFKQSLEPNLKDKTNLIIEKLKLFFNIDHFENELEEVLFFKIYIALFKYENKILRINQVDFNSNKKKVLKVLNSILKELDTEIYHYDKYLIINILRDVVVTKKILEVKKVLIIFNELALVERNFFKNSLKRVLPHITFDFQTNLECKDKIETYKKRYNYILSNDFYDENVIKIDFFDKLLINDVLEKRVFQDVLNNLK